MAEKTERDIFPEPNPDYSDESILTRINRFLETPAGKKSTEYFGKIILPIIDRI